MSMQLTSGCKVNLYLRIGELLPSGYHPLETVFIPLPTPCDILTVKALPSGFQVVCNHPHIDPLNNTLTKAFSLYTSHRPLLQGVQVNLQKHVPMGGGLGGGSANAAVLLEYLQSLPANTPPLPHDTLMSIAAQVGADVPFFLTRGWQKATGIGEVLAPYSHSFAGYCLVLICPEIPVSTAWAFKELDSLRKINTKKQSNHLTTPTHHDSTSSSQAGSFQNDFEEVVFKAHPELKKVKELLLHHGAEIALMSGTGSSLFGIFKKADFAQKFMDKCLYKVYLHNL